MKKHVARAASPLLAIAAVGAVGVEAGHAIRAEVTPKAAVDAWSHCTHYSYPYSQDSNCDTAHKLPNDFIYGTSGTAHRLANSYAAANRPVIWYLWYSSRGGTQHDVTHGQTSVGQILSSPGSSYANCSQQYWSSQAAFCVTLW